MLSDDVSEATSSDAAEDNFTPEFKRLKARRPPPNFEKVIDLHQIVTSRETTSFVNQLCQRSLQCTDDEDQIVGLKSPKDWKVFEFQNYPGFQVVLNPFIDGYQRYWVSRCLHDFPSDKANVTNVTGNPEFDYADAWEQFKQKPTFEKRDQLKKLRWTTLGYHYDWNTKEYSELRRGDFPEDVHILAQYISKALGFGPYNAEAGIVNFYHQDSTLTGHQDHSEEDLGAPIFSLSFGQTCVFLLGGLTKSVEPMAVYLRSGDICVMSGQSRLSYHAVPKIRPPWTEEETIRLKDAFGIPGHLTEVPASTNASTSTNVVWRHEDVSPQQTVAPSGLPHFTAEANCCTSDSKLSDKFEDLQDECFKPEELLQGKSLSSKDRSSNGFSDNNCTKLSREKNFGVKDLNSHILKTIERLDFQPFERYLSTARINLNTRQVFPLEITKSN